MKDVPIAMLFVLVLIVAQVNRTVVAQLSFEQQPIHYSQAEATAPVVKLLRRLDQGVATIESDPKTGYLHSLLQALQIRVSSQTLVFSKTSLQRHLISSKNPRAIYFNDDTYVGWVPNGELIEIASVDPILGTVFYTIQQPGTKRPGILIRQPSKVSAPDG